jgi:protein TonB
MRHPDMTHCLIDPAYQPSWNEYAQPASAPVKATRYLISATALPEWNKYARHTVAQGDSLLRERSAVVGIVISLHLSVFAAYWMHLEKPAMVVSEMSISLANMQVQQPDALPRPKLEPKLPRVIDPQASEKLVEYEEAPPTPVDAAPPSPVVMDTEPDYQAEYLNNPKPPYPLLARRLGYHGKVVLHVEVLVEGRAGQVLLDSSSGYDILDNAAIQTVKTWRFTPAQHLGQPVTQWFLIPVNFSLESKRT